MVAPPPAVAAQIAKLKMGVSDNLKYTNPKVGRRMAAGPGQPGDGGVASDGQIHKPTDIVRVVIELNGSSAAQQLGTKLGTASQEQLNAIAGQNRSERSQVLSAARSKGINLAVRQEFNTVLKGFSAEVQYGDLQTLRQLPGVKKVTLAKVFRPDDNYSTVTVGAKNLWDRPGNLSITGEGTVIAIIDTGIDYRHSELGAQDALDPNGKVIGGYNWADRNDQVLDYSGSGHGVHVAGIAAATGEGALHVKGVAPDAKLIAQKVFSNMSDTPSAYTDDLVAAIDDAVNPASPHHPGVKADVLNMSLGATAGFTDPDDPELAAVHNAVAAGAVVTISSGNSGTSTSSVPGPNLGYAYYRNQDIQAAGSPGTSLDAITVASALNTYSTVSGRELVATVDGALYSGGDQDHRVYVNGSGPFGAFETFGASVHAVAQPGGDFRGCTAADWNGIDVAGKVALVKRGVCAFQMKADNARDAGAVGIVIWNANPDPEVLTMATDAATIPTVMIMNSYGLALNAALSANKPVTVAFNGADIEAQFLDPNGNTMVASSSWGTTPDLKLKPDITAPGGNIWSTVPNNQYESMGGTSMAAPHVAGAAALVRQAHPDYTPLEIKAALMNTAKVLAPLAAGSKPYSPRQQGAGMLQVDKAVDTTVLVTGTDGSPSLSLGAVAPGSATKFTLRLQNKGAAAAQFNLSGAVYRPSASGDYNLVSSSLLTGASVTFDNPVVSVAAGATVDVKGTLNLTAAVAPAAAAYGYFAEGFITLTNVADATRSLSVPYMSYVGKWGGAGAPPVIDPLADDEWSYDYRTGLFYPTEMPGMFYRLGVDYTNQVFDRNAMAINNNPNDIYSMQKAAYPLLTLLRNARNMTIEVVDNGGKVVDKIASEEYMRNIAAQLYYLGYWAWDGTKYNAAKGVREPVAEGKYNVRVKSLTPGQYGGWQSYDMPLMVDNTAPTFEVVGAVPANGVMPGDYTIGWKNPADNLSGIWGYVAIQDDNILSRMEPTATGSFTFHLEVGSHSNMQLCAIDNAGNPGCVGPSDTFTVGHIAPKGPTDVLTTNAWITLDNVISDDVHQVTYQIGTSAPVRNGANGLIKFNLGGKDVDTDVVVNAYSDENATTKLGTAVYHIVLDMTPPVIELYTPDAKRPNLDSRTVEVAGAVYEAHPIDSGVTYTTSEDPTPHVVALDEDGEFSFTLTFKSDGRKDIKFSTMDALHNVAQLSRVFTVDTAPPVVTSVFDPATGSIPSLITVKTSGSGDYAINGTAMDAATYYTLVINDQPEFSLDQPLAATPKAWTYVQNLGGGEDTFVNLAARDSMGNMVSRQLKFTKVATSFMKVTGTSVAADGKTMTVTVLADKSVTAVAVNGVAATKSGTTFTAKVPYAATISVAGKTADPKTAYATVVPMAPKVSDVDSPTKNRTITVSGTTDAAKVNIAVSGPSTVAAVNGLAVNAGAFTKDIVLPATAKDGKYTFTVTAIDALGNLSAPAMLGVILDTAAAKPTLVVPAAVNAAFTAKATPAEAGTLNVTVLQGATNKKAWTVDAPDAGKATDIAVDPAAVPLADGNYTLSVTLTDALGNVSQAATAPFTVDTQAPTATFADVAKWTRVDDTTYTYSLTSTAATISYSLKFTTDAKTVAVKLDNVTATPSKSGNTYTLTKTLTKAVHSYVVTLTDAAGNQTVYNITVTVQ